MEHNQRSDVFTCRRPQVFRGSQRRQVKAPDLFSYPKGGTVETFVTIPLCGKDGRLRGETIVDSEDSDLADGTWRLLNSGHGGARCVYAVTYTGTNGRANLLHRVIMSRQLGRNLEPEERVDHIDGDGLNNRRPNLRLATHAQNMANRRPTHSGTSRYLGVCLSRKSTKRPWLAKIRKSGVVTYLGHFQSEEQAALAYNAAAAAVHGEFARLNVVEAVQP